MRWSNTYERLLYVKKKYRVLCRVPWKKESGKSDGSANQVRKSILHERKKPLYLERADYPIWRVIKPVIAVQKGGSNSVWISFSFRIESNRVESNEGADRTVPSTRFNLCQIRRRRPMMRSLYPPSLAPSRTLCHSFETLCQAWFNYARSAVVEATSA